jgi:DNA-binding IclR family transcriptional regulator
VLLAGKLEAMLRAAAEGLSVATIARDANASQSQVRGLLRELQNADQVRRLGAGRGSRWKLITDEQRVAERAAELEALNTSTS